MFQTNAPDARVSDGSKFVEGRTMWTVHLSRTGSFQTHCCDVSHSHFSQLSIKEKHKEEGTPISPFQKYGKDIRFYVSRWGGS